MIPADLAPLLEDRRGDLVRYCQKQAGRVLRYETAEDLAQGIHLAALQRAPGLEYRSDDEFAAWLFTVARGYLADRRDYWYALKRRCGNLLRITVGAASTPDPRAVGEPAATDTGPTTFAARREQLVLAVKALSLLMSRDQQLVRWYSEGTPLAEQAEALGISYDAVRVAQGRALDRFRRTFDFVAS